MPRAATALVALATAVAALPILHGCEGRPLPRTNMHIIQIFTPPYLFNADGRLGTRPSLTGVGSTTLHYGQSFTITIPMPRQSRE
jgi:hypothetical protein